MTGAPLRRLLQTKPPKSHPAKRVTQAEFEDIMRVIMDAANKVAATPEWREKTGGRGGARYSFDGASAHWSVEVLERLGIVGDVRFPLPVKSPDMHQAIEHVFGRLKPKIRIWLYHHPAKRDVAQYMAQVEELFWKDKEVAGLDAVEGDVARLHGCYQKVIDCKGGEIPKPWR